MKHSFPPSPSSKHEARTLIFVHDNFLKMLINRYELTVRVIGNGLCFSLSGTKNTQVYNFP